MLGDLEQPTTKNFYLKFVFKRSNCDSYLLLTSGISVTNQFQNGCIMLSQ